MADQDRMDYVFRSKPDDEQNDVEQTSPEGEVETSPEEESDTTAETRAKRASAAKDETSPPEKSTTAKAPAKTASTAKEK